MRRQACTSAAFSEKVEVQLDSVLGLQRRSLVEVLVQQTPLQLRDGGRSRLLELRRLDQVPVVGLHVVGVQQPAKFLDLLLEERRAVLVDRLVSDNDLNELILDVLLDLLWRHVLFGHEELSLVLLGRLELQRLRRH